MKKKVIWGNIVTAFIATILLSAFILSIVGLIGAINKMANTTNVPLNKKDTIDIKDTIYIKVLYDKDSDKVFFIKEEER